MLPHPHPPADSLMLHHDNIKTLQYYFSKHLAPQMTVYDIGCGTKPFKNFMQNKVAAYVGIDIETGFYDASHIDIIGSAEAVPLADGVADAVISSQVLEHLPNPYQALAEAARILKTGGLLFISCPFLYPIHADPYDYHRFTKNAFTKAFSTLGLTIIDQHTHAGFWYCINQFCTLYLGGFNRGWLKKLRLISAFGFLLRQFFLLLHTVEGFCLNHMGKDQKVSRQSWVVNYVYVLKKA